MQSNQHRPVLLDEVLAALAVRPDGIYLDGTFGRGGHAAAVLARLGPEGQLLAMDKDPQAVACAHERFGGDGRFSIVRGSFTALRAVAEQRGWLGKVAGILLDLGVSSPQLDDAQRGFSFLRDGPLDMRMDPESGESAAVWLAHAAEAEIAEVLHEYGEERYARRIAHAIVRERQAAPIVTTGRLAEVIAAAHPRWERDRHPATRSFQAIRIRVNRELEELEQALADSVDLLAPGGRLAVISFHSLEDRPVKRFMRDAGQGPKLPRGLPIRAAEMYVPRLHVVGKAVRAGEAELAANPRARSAVLRVAERAG
jgi:16S rRNA (cytosine1402-N4)-methyltransferase